jgi:hypothetical protein
MNTILQFHLLPDNQRYRITTTKQAPTGLLHHQNLLAKPHKTGRVNVVVKPNEMRVPFSNSSLRASKFKDTMPMESLADKVDRKAIEGLYLTEMKNSAVSQNRQESLDAQLLNIDEQLPRGLRTAGA